MSGSTPADLAVTFRSLARRQREAIGDADPARSSGLVGELQGHVAAAGAALGTAADAEAVASGDRAPPARRVGRRHAGDRPRRGARRRRRAAPHRRRRRVRGRLSTFHVSGRRAACDRGAMRNVRLDHAAINTTDLDATIAFYEHFLGLRPGWRPPIDIPGAWLYPADGDQAIVHVLACNEARDRGGMLDHVAVPRRRPRRLRRQGPRHRRVVPGRRRAGHAVHAGPPPRPERRQDRGQLRGVARRRRTERRHSRRAMLAVSVPSGSVARKAVDDLHRRRLRRQAQPHRQHVGIVPSAGAAAVSASVHSAARTPATLLAAIDTPVPVQHHTIPRSASPVATAAPTRAPDVGPAVRRVRRRRARDRAHRGAPRRRALTAVTSSVPTAMRTSARARAAPPTSARGCPRRGARRRAPSTASTSTRPRRCGGSSIE